ncbi:sialic acid-binding Ig-like lectin 15 [Hypanus sabinus]|uniref:sialic acid-binding Ig-like lectin 15 n=1 Tax=Hypanus sabinus TaxID=79690 RepID=UPI0028C479FF|nr:sialic acid-binding Ig-like lectin 15 [Hypanus sabinus]
MRSLRLCLCTVLLSVSVRGYNYSIGAWSMSGADVVSAVEGASAVLPCTFTHPRIEVAPNGSVIWSKIGSGAAPVVFNCTFFAPGRSRCNMTQEAGGGRFGFVGNHGKRDASIMVERLNRSDGGQYQCRVELNIYKLRSVVLTKLSVTAPKESVSVMTGTKGASAALPCVFTRPRQSLTAHTVTWMRKEPYRHIVTFMHQGNGSWAAENGVTRYELVGDPELGNASTRIKQLSAEDTGGYLCLAEFRDLDKHYPHFHGQQLNPPYIHVFQSEIRLQVRPGTGASETVLMLCIPVGLKTLALLVMGAVLYCDKLRKGEESSNTGG